MWLKLHLYNDLQDVTYCFLQLKQYYEIQRFPIQQHPG